MPSLPAALSGLHSTLAGRIFVANAAVLAAATLVVAITPVTVSFPIVLTEAVVLAAGLAMMLAIDLILVRRALGPLRRLAMEVRGVDPQRPPRALDVVGGGAEVAELVDAFDRMLEGLAVERRERARQALAAQEAERARIARDLHDEIGQQLTGVLLQLGRLRAALPEPAHGILEEAQESARASLDDVRRVAERLRPVALDDLGLSSAIAALCSSIQAGADLRVERRAAVLPPLRPETELVLYRVAQESLTNVVRHAAARSVTLRLDADDDHVRLWIRDDGRGLDGAHWGGGLVGMQERAALVGGELRVTSEPGRGTTVHLLVPLAEERS